MRKIPVVFCFDDNLAMPAGVSITSLLENAHSDTFYDIFILHDERAVYPTLGILERLYDRYTNFNITYRSVGNQFQEAFEIRGITVPAYYRLLIPELIPEYDKIMYHDVDVIFRSDLSAIFDVTDMAGYYIAGVISPGFLYQESVQRRIGLGLDPQDYILSGNLIFNAALLRANQIVDRFRKEAKHNYKHQDMDVINIVCKGKIKRLSPVFCGMIELFKLAVKGTKQEIYTSKELSDMQEWGIVHYNGPKPWNSWCPNFDIWWEYYRKSVYYDPGFYFDFFYSRLNEYDKLSFSKRLKILFRYFKHRQKQN
ncbi:glycosyltransferase family 8 protein [Sphingobacterium chuzhouense]|uniref:Glycosyltransferase family 8 protein n=1 Tax=Sphingobacterium chuzhouense TaxID=1742264 RepID=A0ABR7XTK6_9SPHI|nr:glycosyltransferase family 8 protein [Sphingobacterium chuzhouense]MBD1422500.1 glycosyltransferase family 8 protein [Sphingobacterium chuzhouense]